MTKPTEKRIQKPKKRDVLVVRNKPGLQAAVITAEKPESLKQKEEKEKKKTPFLPWPTGTSPFHKRRVEDGGKFIRLKRK